jgi:Flp pilus assembly protein TadG
MRIARDCRGAAALEFAFVIGVIVMAVFGAIQVGQVLAARSDVSHALSQVVRSVHLAPQTTREEIVAELERRLTRYTARELDVEVTEIATTSYMRIAVRFPARLSIPFLPVRELSLQVETLAPMVSPLQAGG